MIQIELQRIANKFFNDLGNDTALVVVEIFDNQKTLAEAKGFKFPIFNVPFGQIRVSSSLLDSLSEDEIKFVLAHEVVHIDQNHLPIGILAKLPEAIIEDLGKNESNAKVLSTVLKLVKLYIHSQGDLPPDVAITKQQELQADFWAIWLTKNKTSAITCLRKLVNNNLNTYSHIWEVFDVKLPIMTMRERIIEINKTLSYYEKVGYIFN